MKKAFEGRHESTRTILTKFTEHFRVVHHNPSLHHLLMARQFKLQLFASTESIDEEHVSRFDVDSSGIAKHKPKHASRRALKRIDFGRPRKVEGDELRFLSSNEPCQ